MKQSQWISRPDVPAATSQGGRRDCLLLAPLAVLMVGIAMAVVTNNLITVNAATLTTGVTQLAGVFTEEVLWWSQNIGQWAGLTGLSQNLIATVMQIESCGDPDALSPSGAMGLFQVMPFHFAELDDPYQPETNAARGLDYLQRAMQKAGGNVYLALAGYNGGIGVIPSPESTWPAETQRYVYWGAGIFEEANSGADVSQRLQEWLSRGGSSLCRQAHLRLGIP